MPWPSPSDYQDAIQNPRHCFDLPELQAAEVARTPLGLPRVASGNFASVYELRSPHGRWAVRCFLRQVSDQERRYHEISAYLNAHPLPWLVDFDYLHNGMCIGRTWYPIVKMDWVDGMPLHRHVERLLGDPAALRALADQWRRLVAELRTIGIAHGDLQHGNILVARGEMRLVDYDGMYVPAFHGERSPELGRANYQHPARSPEDYGPELDNFAALVIYLSLRALAGDAGLWRFHDGENLILTAADFRSPGSSAVFARLRTHPAADVRALAGRLASLCAGPLAQVPPLEQVITSAAPSVVPAAAAPSPPPASGTTPGVGATSGAAAPAESRGRPAWLDPSAPSVPSVPSAPATAVPTSATVVPTPAAGVPAPTEPAAAQTPQGGGAISPVPASSARGRRSGPKTAPAAGGAPGGAATVAAPAPRGAGGVRATLARGCMVVTFFLLLGLVVLGWWSYQWWTGRVGPWARVPGTSAPAPSGPAPSSRPSTSSPPGPAATKGTPQGAARAAGTADLRRATALIGERRYSEAATALEQARQRGPDMTQPAIAREYYADLARARSGRGQFRESLGPFREALHRPPVDPTLWLDYGWALESLGETTSARSAYNQALTVATSEDQRAQARAGLARLGGR